VCEKWLEIRHSRVFPYPEEAELTLSWVAGTAGDRKVKKGEENGFNRGPWV
jgi:hypothetical protein